MCATCGCATAVHEHPSGHEHGHEHEHPHAHEHEHHPRAVVALEERLLARNDGLAAKNRLALEARGIVALNLVSSPGAGKTTLLERTITDLRGELHFGVIEGDQETELDADRIRATGARAIQVNTGTGCHLDASMVRGAIETLNPRAGSLLMIENVGNLVCPALFDLGERAKVLVASVTEGADKPLKYPHMFRAAEMVVLNKIDLLPHLAFDVKAFVRYAQSVNPRLTVLQVSATRGDGLGDWYGWLRSVQGLTAA
jgi:hydrogenase nickel incorporation protein HypB